jgi:hypothetical protein
MTYATRDGRVVVIGIMVPTLIVSTSSMHVRLPIPYEHPLSFWVVMGLSAVALPVFMYLWRRKKW